MYMVVRAGWKDVGALGEGVGGCEGRLWWWWRVGEDCVCVCVLFFVVKHPHPFIYIILHSTFCHLISFLFRLSLVLSPVLFSCFSSHRFLFFCFFIF